MWKYILGVLLLILLVGGFFGYTKYEVYLKPNVPAQLKEKFIEIPRGSSFDEVTNLLFDKGFILDKASFEEVAAQLKYKKEKMRTGRYQIESNWNNYELVRHLRGGKKATVKVVLNYERLPENVAAKAAKTIEADSLSIYNLLIDTSYLHQKGYTREDIMSIFIPNTYEFYWSTSAEEFIDKMLKEHQKFWDKNDRLQKAKAQNMSPKEVYTLASIVEKETLKNDEKKRIAGVYLNRLKRNIALQADPTVVFATRQFDLRRILNKHLEFDSPYNTYMYPGLPPGPISLASISSIDAVLNPEQHKYIYFCAKPDNSGYHTFAKTLSAHNVNAKKYHRWLNKQRRNR